MIYLSLFYEFFKVGLFAIGGGLATIPFLSELAERKDWYTVAEFADMIAISESTPGAFGVNMSTYAGYNAGGILGAVIATTALTLPSFIIICIISKVLLKFRKDTLINTLFYAIRPASAGLIASAMLIILRTSLIGESGVKIGGVVMFLSFLAVIILSEKVLAKRGKKPLHPVVFIAAGGVIGGLLGGYIC